MLCTMGQRRCRSYCNKSNVEEECRYCGFNLDELNRRLRDIRANGLSDIGKGIHRYMVKHQYGSNAT